MPNQEAEDVRELLAFDPSTAGGMMNTEFAFVSETAARDEVLEWLRHQEFNLEQLDTIVILDKLGHFAGAVPLARMLLAAPDQRMAELKTDPLVSVTADASEKDVFELFDKYNLRMLTVLDHDRRPIGSITVDDVVSRLVNA
jgi:Mg/Co/Ni transporter MgtE